MLESFTRDQLLSCARGEMFGPENGKLPLPSMLMMDRITHISDQGGAHGKGRIYEIDIKRIVERKLVLAIADAKMFVDGREIYAATDLRVGLFTSTDSL